MPLADIHSAHGRRWQAGFARDAVYNIVRGNVHLGADIHEKPRLIRRCARAVLVFVFRWPLNFRGFWMRRRAGWMQDFLLISMRLERRRSQAGGKVRLHSQGGLAPW